MSFVETNAANDSAAEKNWLIDWVHRVEFDPDDEENSSKRLPGIVTELYFERTLAKQASAGLPKQLAFGWSYGTEFGSERRTWVKVTDGSEYCVNERFIAAILSVNTQDRFFIAQPSVKMSAPDTSPVIHWNICEVEIRDTVLRRCDYQQDAFRHKVQIEEKIRRALISRQGMSVTPNFRRWLEPLDNVTLRRLLATRCLMNFGGLYLTDIDAVGLDSQEQLAFVEFKRKGPATGYGYQAVPASVGENNLALYLARIDELMKFKSSKNRLRSLEREKREALLKQSHDEVRLRLADRSQWTVTGALDSFGLDVSHAKNVDLCAKAGLIYRHIIWESKKSDPTDLLTPELRPLESQTLLALNVCPAHFDRMSKTEGDDSGTYTKWVRFQLMIPRASFEFIR